MAQAGQRLIWHGPFGLVLPLPQMRSTLHYSTALKTGHGGKRKGAGRKPTGRRAYLVRVKPKTMRVIRETAKAAGFKTPGELLDADYAP